MSALYSRVSALRSRMSIWGQLMRARFFQHGNTDAERAADAIVFFRRLFPGLPAPNILLLANIALAAWDGIIES